MASSKFVGESCSPSERVPSSHRLVVEVVSSEVDEENCVGDHDDHLRRKGTMRSATVLDASKLEERREKRC